MMILKDIKEINNLTQLYIGIPFYNHRVIKDKTIKMITSSKIKVGNIL
jgi:hypothetical protein